MHLHLLEPVVSGATIEDLKQLGSVDGGNLGSENEDRREFWIYSGHVLEPLHSYSSIALTLPLQLSRNCLVNEDSNDVGVLFENRGPTPCLLIYFAGHIWGSHRRKVSLHGWWLLHRQCCHVAFCVQNEIFANVVMILDLEKGEVERLLISFPATMMMSLTFSQLAAKFDLVFKWTGPVSCASLRLFDLKLFFSTSVEVYLIFKYRLIIRIYIQQAGMIIIPVRRSQVYVPYDVGCSRVLRNKRLYSGLNAPQQFSTIVNLLSCQKMAKLELLSRPNIMVLEWW